MGNRYEAVEKKRYMPGLDGLRAVAVLGVIAYHLGASWLPGGFVGVGIFFVLSGYLITDLLSMEWRASGAIRLGQFWLRRARRLLPAMGAMLAVTAAVLAVAEPSRLAGLQGDIWSSVFYVGNWYLIFHQVSYFESFGPVSPFGHLWSLAVEEQFYLIWPLLFAGAMRLRARRGTLLLLLLAGAAGSALAMALLYEPGGDPSRVYYGTDTRAFALLLGAALAVVWPSARAAGSSLHRRGLLLLLEFGGGAGLAIMLLLMLHTGEYDRSLYPGGFLLLSAASAMVIAAAVHPLTLTGRLLAWKPLKWVGMRSYAMYLWHYPVVTLSGPLLKDRLSVPAAVVLQLGLTLALTVLSWRLVEEPVRRGGFRILWQGLKEAGQRLLHPGQSGARLYAMFSIGILVVLGLSCTGITDLQLRAAVGLAVLPAAGAADQQTSGDHAQTPTHSTSDKSGKDEAQAGAPGVTASDAGRLDAGNSESANSATTRPGAGSTSESRPGSANSDDAKPGEANADARKTDKVKSGAAKPEAGNPAASSRPTASSRPSGGKTEANAARTTGKGMTVVGDSVILDAEPYLKKALPDMKVDGEVGRQFYQVLKIVQELKNGKSLNGTVVIESGTNGPFSEKQMKELMELLQDTEKVVLVNTRVPRKWQDTVNEALTQTAQDYPNVVLADWYARSEGKEDFFEKDGVHLKPKGAEDYANMLLELLQPKEE